MFNFFKVFFVFVLIVGCQSGGGQRAPQSKVSSKKIPFELITPVGENSQPSFSPAGDRLLFVGSQYFQHSHSQVYEYDFDKRSSRRLTFQDGIIKSPTYLTSTEILYSSNTDQIKENLWENGFQNRISQFGGNVYYSDLFGNNIHRLTEGKGSDLYVRGSENNGDYKVLFVRHEGEKSIVFVAEPQKEKQQRFYAVDDKEIITPHFLNHEYIYFLEKDKDGKTELVGLNVRSKKEVYRKGFDNAQSVFLGPLKDSLILLQNDGKASSFKSVLPKGQCDSLFMQIPFSVVNADINRETPTRLALELKEDGLSRIYIYNFEKEIVACVSDKKE
ncbi:MAG: TolB family protein [Bdellovibrionia bacterium]